MNSHPLYERPDEDQGRQKRTEDWNEAEIIGFLDDRFDDPLEEFEVSSYEELGNRINELGLIHDEESDWRHKQVPDLGEKNFEYETKCYLMRLEDDEERPTKSDDYVPAGVTLKDENGEIQLKYEK